MAYCTSCGTVKCPRCMDLREESCCDMCDGKFCGSCRKDHITLVEGRAEDEGLAWVCTACAEKLTPTC